MTEIFLCMWIRIMCWRTTCTKEKLIKVKWTNMRQFGKALNIHSYVERMRNEYRQLTRVCEWTRKLHSNFLANEAQVRADIRRQTIKRYTLIVGVFVYLAETPRAANGWRMCVCCSSLFCSTLSRMFLRRTRARLSSPLHTSRNTSSISCLRMSSVSSTTLKYTQTHLHQQGLLNWNLKKNNILH